MKKILLIALLVVGVFASNYEPKLKNKHFQLLWIEKDFKSIVKIEFMDSTIIYDSLMTISYGYQLPIPGVISAYINFTNFDKQQYPISNIEKVYINNKLYSGKHIRTYQSILTAVPYFLFSIIFYTFSTS